MGKITSGSSGVLDGAGGVARVGDSIEVTAAELASALGSPAGDPQNTSLNIDGTTSNPFFNPDGTLKPGIPGTAMIGVNAAPAPGLSNTHVTLQDLINVTGSAGLTRGGTLKITVDGVSVDAGIVLMRAEDADDAQLNFYDFDGVTLYASELAAETSYIGVVWNSSGKPTIEIRAEYDWNKNTEVPLGTVSNRGTLEVLNSPHRLNNAVTNIIERFDATFPATRDASIGGLLLSESAGRKINVTAGKIWARLNTWDHSAKTGAQLINTYWDGSGLAFSTSSQWDNLQYNDVDAGTLTTLADSTFGSLWFFMHAESGAIFSAYGTVQHTNSNLAALEKMPPYLPQSFKNRTVFLGRLVFQKGQPAAASIDSPYDGFIHTALPAGGGGAGIADTDSLPEGATNLYFAAARAQNAVIVQTINNGDTTHSPSSDVVFDALALKANTTHTHDAGSITAGTFSDARLSANVTLRNALNTFTANNTFSSARTRFGPSWDLAIEAATADSAAPRVQSYNAKPLYINELGNPVIIGSGGLQVGTSITINGNAVWHPGNDGADSGLDSDLLDGQHGSYYLNASNLNAGTVPTARMGSGTANTTTFLRGDNTWQIISSGTNNPLDQGNGFVSWTGEATVTPSTSVALLDSTGAALSPTKTYKVAACSVDSSAQRGAVVLFVGDGSGFVRRVIYEQGTTSSNVQLYLNAGVPSVSVYGGSGSYRIPYRIEEVPNFGQALSEFGILQRLLDAPSDGKSYVRKDGMWVEATGGGSMIYRKQAIFTSSGTFTLPSTALAAVIVTVIAGGASGAAGSYQDSNWTWTNLYGGGGGQKIKANLTLTPGSSYSVVVGSGGAAVSSGIDNVVNGNDGGNSSFGSFVTAQGGVKGGNNPKIHGKSGHGNLALRLPESTVSNVYPLGVQNYHNSLPGAGGGLYYPFTGNVDTIAAGVPNADTAPGGGSVASAQFDGACSPGAGEGKKTTPAGSGTIPGAGGGSCCLRGSGISAVSGAGFRGQVEVIYWDTVP